MITVEGLSKSYRGSSFAVRDVSFRVDKGEIVGFSGRTAPARAPPSASSPAFSG